MRHSLLLLAAFATISANAAVIGTIGSESEGLLRLHDTVGLCVNGARYADYIRPNEKTIPACWKIGNGILNVAFFDADVIQVPASMVEKP